MPVIGCDCPVCTSSDSRNRRLRTSALLETQGLQVLFDVGPDLRQQALAVGLKHVDAVLLTHGHSDHIAGIDDLRPLNFFARRSTPLYGNAATLDMVRDRFAYAFESSSQGSSRPELSLLEVLPYEPFRIGPVEILPLEVLHGTWSILGFRIGKLGYVTDASAISRRTLEHLYDLDVLVLNALRITPHPTHFSLAEALEVVAELRPRRTLLVHMTHDVEYAAVTADLPAGVELGYDGLSVQVGEDANSD